MGEAYRGLTIRIGADAQPFNRVLSTINSASRVTAKEVTRITQALKKDPGNTKLLANQIRALGDNSRATATQIALMQTEFKQLLASGPGGLKQLENAMKGIDAEAASARIRFNTLDTTLEGVYDTILKYNIATKQMSKDDASKALKKLLSSARNTKEGLKELEAELRRVWSADKSLIPFDTKNVDEAIAKWKELRAEQVRVQEQMQNIDRVKGLKNLSIDIELLRSHLKETRIEAINLRNAYEQMGDSQGAREAANKQKLLAEATKEAENHLRSMVSVSKSLPKDIEASNAKMRALDQATKLINEQLTAAKEKLKTLDGGSVKKIEAEFITTGNAVRTLTDRAAGFEAEVESIEAEIRGLRSQMEGLAATSTGFQKAENEISELNAKLRIARTNLVETNAQLATANKAHAYRTAQADITSLNGKLAATNALVASGTRSWAQLGSSIRTAGYSMMASVGSLAMIGGMYAIQAATDIDSAYRNMRKTVNGTEEQFEHLRDAALKFSQTHFTSADQILEIESIGGQLGIQVQNLEKFAEVVSNMDIATNLDTETISQNLGQLTNIMNDMEQGLQSGPRSMEAYGDALVRLGNNTAAQEDKIQNVMMRIASMGTICNMSTPDLLALSAATAATGQGAEAAGTALSKTFSGIESAVNGSERALSKLQNAGDLTEDEIEELTDAVEKGQNKLAKFAEVAGMSAEDFKAAWNGNNVMQDAFVPFIEGLQRIDREGGSVDSTLTELGITSVRQKQTLQGLTQTVNILGNAITMSNDAWNGVSDQWGAAGDAAREAERKAEGFSGQLEKLKNNAKVLASDLLETLTPALTGLVGVAQNVVDAFRDMPDGMKQMIITGAGIAALSGPMMIFGGTVLSAGSSFMNFFSKTKEGATLAERLGSTIMNAGAKVEKFGSKSVTAITPLNKLGTAIGNVGVGITSLSGLALPLTAVFGTLGVAVAGSIANYERLTEKTRAAKKANEELSDSSKTLSSTLLKSFETIGGAVGSNLTISFEDAAASYQSFADKVAESKLELASSAEDMSTKILTIKTAVSDATKLMEKLQKAGSLTELEYEQLSQSIDTYNQTTGDSIQVTRDADGNIRVLKDGVILTADAFNDLAQAEENAAKKEYFSKQKNASFENMIESQKQIQTWTQQVKDAEKALKDFEEQNRPATGANYFEQMAYQNKVQEYRDKVESAKESLKGARDELDKATKSERSAVEMTTLLNDKTAAQIGTFENLIATNNDVMAAFASSENSVYAFKGVLEKAGISVSDLKKENLAETIRNWDGTLPGLISALTEFGAVTDEDAKKLQDLNLIQIEDKIYKVDNDGSIQWEENELRDLQDIKIGNKHYYVTDDGSVYDQKGNCMDLEAIKFNDKYYLVTDGGTVYNEEGKIEAFNGIFINDKPFIVTDNGTIVGKEGELQVLNGITLDEKQLYISNDGIVTATGEVYTFDQLGINPKDYIVDDGGTVRVQADKVQDLDRKIKAIPKKIDTKATADTWSAMLSLGNLETKLNNLNGKTATVTVIERHVTQGENASGGFLSMATQKRIAAHAAGAFITNGVTYIGTDKYGVRHIAGEAGREFVQHHADGTTSIIPIQNKKYMAPFVAAVADMLSGGDYDMVSKQDLYKVASAVIKSNQQKGDIVLVLDDREVGRAVRKFA